MHGGDDLVRYCLDELKSPGWEKFVYVSESLDWYDDALERAEVSKTPEMSCQEGVLPLSTRRSGDRICIVSLNCGAANHRLMGMGLLPGAVLEVISCTATGSVIVALQDHRLGLGADMAQYIQVIDAEQQVGRSTPSTSNTATARTTTNPSTPMIPMQISSNVSPASTVKLRDVAIGTWLRVVGYEPTARDYKRKLLAMGLTPGTEVRVTRHAPMGDPTEISVRGFQLSLRKTEAEALIVEPITRS